MKREELVEEIVKLCLRYLEEHGQVHAKDIVARVLIDLSYATACMHDGCVAKSAIAMKETRTTASMRFSQYKLSEEQVKAICKKYGIPYKPLYRHRPKKKGLS